MKAVTVTFACLIFALLLASNAGAAAAVPGLDPQTVARKAAAARVPFIENDGQIDHDDVSYYARLSTGTLFVTTDGDLVYSFRATPRDGWAFRESFVDDNPSHPVGADPSGVRVSRFMGSQPDAWYRSLRTFDRVELGEIYPGIRVALRAAGNNVEKLLYLAPGARASAIKIGVEGVEALALDAGGRLVLKTALGDVVFTAPVAYQTIDGERHPVDVSYTLADDTYGFELGDYRPDHEVVIDPLLNSTFIGGSNPSPPGNYDDDIVHDMVSDGDTIYIAGATQSPDFPIVMGYDETIGGNFPDGFVTRMTSDLSTVLASTYIGTEYSDRVGAITIDDAGLIVIVGQAGWGFPVTDGAYTHSGTTPTGGGFVAKLSPDLSTLVASAIPTPSDYPRKLALGNDGVYFVGATNNPSFPITPDAYKSTCCPPQGSYGIRPFEGFAGKLSSDLTTLEAMTYLGGHSASAITVAPDSSVFITDGFDEAITGYVARFDDALTARPAYLSYYPGSTSGSSRTYFNDVAIDGGSVVVVGQTYMNDLPATEGAYDTTCGTDGVCDGVGDLLVPRSDGFVAKYSYDLATTEALTYLGGSYHESIRAVTLDADGGVLVVGETTSTDFPTTPNASDPDCGIDGQCDPSGTYNTPQADAFVARLSSDLSQLEYGSYLGGSEEDRAWSLALDGAGHLFVGGNTVSPDFPTTPGAFDDSYNGGTSDAFVSRFGGIAADALSSTPGETCGEGMPQMLVDGYDPVGKTLTVSYEPGCSTMDNNVYYGHLEDVATYGYSGQICNVGMTGTTSFSLPNGSFFFVVVGDNDTVEGSYGRDGTGAERPSSGICGFAQDLGNPCSQP